MITSLPSNYTLRFLLSGRVGVNAAAHAWGRTLQLGGHDHLHASVQARWAATLTQMVLCSAHGTRKLTLSEDKLSAQLHCE